MPYQALSTVIFRLYIHPFMLTLPNFACMYVHLLTNYSVGCSWHPTAELYLLLGYTALCTWAQGSRVPCFGCCRGWVTALGSRGSLVCSLEQGTCHLLWKRTPTGFPAYLRYALANKTYCGLAVQPWTFHRSQRSSIDIMVLYFLQRFYILAAIPSGRLRHLCPRLHRVCKWESVSYCVLSNNSMQPSAAFPLHQIAQTYELAQLVLEVSSGQACFIECSKNLCKIEFICKCNTLQGPEDLSW